MMKISAYELEKNGGEICLVKEKSISYECNEAINSPIKVASFVKEIFRTSSKLEEHFYIISLSNSGKVIGVFDAFHGSGTTSVVDIRGVILRILLSGGQHCIVAHNHPSGNCEPSNADIELTNNLKNACKFMGLGFLDHLILTEDSYYSFKEMGRL